MTTMNSSLTNWHLYPSIGTLRVLQVSLHTGARLYTQNVLIRAHEGFYIHYKTGEIVFFFIYLCVGSPVSAQHVIMAAPPHPTVLPSGPGKALALVPGGGQVQPIHVLQNAPQSSVTTVRVVTSGPLTSNPPNGYSAPSVGGPEGNSEIRGTATEISFRSACRCLKCLFAFITHMFY